MQIQQIRSVLGFFLAESATEKKDLMGKKRMQRLELNSPAVERRNQLYL